MFRSSAGRRGAVIGVAFLLAVALAAWWWWPRDPAPVPPRSPSQPLRDPRLEVAARWPNVHPDVKYVGDEVCAGCHGDIARTYRRHPMGHSLAPVDAAAEAARLDADGHFTAGPFRYRIERKGDRLVHSESAADGKGGLLYEHAVKVDFAVGSGRRGRSYLINTDGFLTMSPITLYPQKKNGLWALSPGYEQTNRHFTRPVIADCLFCHSNRVEPVEDTTHRYHEPIFRGHAIGCERCHGPGELHVALRSKRTEVQGIDRTIVNPAHLAHTLREAVCQQCHLQGEEKVLRRGRGVFDFRPGMSLEDFMVNFVKPAKYQTDAKFVGTVEQMVASRCYQESRGERKMGCTSCHDPHAVPARVDKPAFYRARCASCHADNACSLPPAVRAKDNGNNCVACHMPPTGSEVQHTSISDHRIPRRPAVPAPEGFNPWPLVHDMPLAAFHLDEAASIPKAERDRNLGVALMQLASHKPKEAAMLARHALPLLEPAFRGDPADLSVADARAYALWMHGRLDDALAAYEAILAKAPRREVTLHWAAALATHARLKRLDLAETYLHRALEVNPRRAQSHYDLATMHTKRGEWKVALAAAEKSLQINPGSVTARSLVVVCHLRLGDKSRAQAEFDALLQLEPPERRDGAKAWFARESG